jgi:hypothetical protein
MNSIPLKGKVWLRRSSLDTRLAQGASPDEAPELAARATQLVSQRTRCGLATGIVRAVEAAAERSGSFSSSAPLNRQEIQSARAELLQLAEDLRSPGPLQPRGVALTEQLLTHGDSPLYGPSIEGSLRDAVRHARTALLLI